MPPVHQCASRLQRRVERQKADIGGLATIEIIVRGDHTPQTTGHKRRGTAIEHVVGGGAVEFIHIHARPQADSLCSPSR